MRVGWSGRNAFGRGVENGVKTVKVALARFWCILVAFGRFLDLWGWVKFDGLNEFFWRDLGLE